MRKTTNKIVSYKDLDSVLNKIKTKRKILIGGCFDIVHYGHLMYLTKSKELGDILIIALESDEFIETRKNRKPIHIQKERAEILAALSMTDIIVLLPHLKSDKDYFEMIKIIKPDIIAAVEGDSQIKNMQKQADSVGGILKIVMPRVKEFSSSKIIRHAPISSN